MESSGGGNSSFWWESVSAIANWIWVVFILPAVGVARSFLKLEERVTKIESESSHNAKDLEEVKGDIRQIRDNTFELLKYVHENNSNKDK